MNSGLIMRLLVGAGTHRRKESHGSGASSVRWSLLHLFGTHRRRRRRRNRRFAVLNYSRYVNQLHPRHHLIDPITRNEESAAVVVIFFADQLLYLHVKLKSWTNAANRRFA